ncbi:MAG: M28 family peptidase [Candidatus Aegiribacteria sp.]|nr:M28 family peptidase [Candidatus Aegiribacteria sp.]
MRIPILFAISLLITGTVSAETLFIIPDRYAEATDSYVIVYRTEEHVVAFGTWGKRGNILDTDASDLSAYALVTVRNDNGILQATELGRVLYRNGRTLIVKLLRPLTGDFLRTDIFMVQPLRETKAPATPIPIPVRGEYDDSVADIVAAVSEDSLISITTNYQNYLTRHSSTSGFDSACAWSHNRFLSYGLNSEIRHFSSLGYDCQNVIATQTGTVNPDQYWIICGHLDSTSPQPQTDAPGADDNGSGSAAVMEAARIMSQYDFEYTVRYCLWGGEEQGLFGSAHYADSVKLAGDVILGVVNLDMIFYGPSPYDKAALNYNTASTGLGLAFDAVSDTYVPALTKTVANPPVSASDHASFWVAGYPAMLSIEMDWGSNPYYHQTTDVIANYTQYFPFGTNMAKAAIATVAYLAVPSGTGVEEDSFHNSIGTVTMRLSSNPVNFMASAIVNVPSTCLAKLSLFDISGREVQSVSETLPAGSSPIDMNVQSLVPGIYLLRLDANGESATSSMVIIK